MFLPFLNPDRDTSLIFSPSSLLQLMLGLQQSDMISGLRSVLKVLLRLSVCQAGEAGVPSLRHRQVRQGLVDVGRDEDGHAAVLLLHHLRVDLAGVAVLV